MPNEQFQVAVIGMAGRFPGADSLEKFWANILGSAECVSFFSEQELRERKVSPHKIADPRFVPAGAPLPDPGAFAAPFFGYSPREAEVIDPQQRLFLETAWHAIEDAGYTPEQIGASTGVFASTSLSTYMLFDLLRTPAFRSGDRQFEAMIGTDKDFIGTRTSYKLDLRGPSLTVQTGCSSSLVAVHLAVQHLLTYQCDLALAGGASVGVPQRTGYLYEPDGILSRDGHTKPFDADASGTLFGEGVGVVLLKRYAEALRDRDNVQAVILGSAVTNDGHNKVSYTAPSISGQAEVIRRAMASAGITADEIGYVEAHGTATSLGDPIEFAALTEAFQSTSKLKKFCGLGSVKANIGHLDAAAGIAGLIKVVLMLKHRWIPGLVNFSSPNPRIDIDGSPFYLTQQSRQWDLNKKFRAGVSSFGIGGTNAHVVLEESVGAPKVDSSHRPLQVFCVSAQSATAADAAAERLANFLEGCNEDDVADAAYTLHVGRVHFPHRRSIICSDRLSTIEALRSQDPKRVFQDTASSSLKLGFMFPGGGTQYVGMGKEIYETETTFREHMDRCFSLLRQELDVDLKALLYLSSADSPLVHRLLSKPSIALPAIFATEYALAEMLMKWGIRPQYMIGHSLGEYAAACLAGVFSLQDALALVALRGRLLESLPEGAMLSVYMSELDLLPLLPEDISLAAVNDPQQCVVSGAMVAIERFARNLDEREVEYRRLHIEAAAHSILVEPVMGKLRDFVGKFELNRPAIPFISNFSGNWIGTDEATDPEYWVKHLRETVRFADGVKTMMQEDALQLIEVGPSNHLTTLVRGRKQTSRVQARSCMRHPQENRSDLEVLYECVAKVWNSGHEVAWNAFYGSENRRRISLPNYPFERQQYWVRPDENSTKLGYDDHELYPIKDIQVFLPSWQKKALFLRNPTVNSSGQVWILFSAGSIVDAALLALLESTGHRIVVVRKGARFRQLNESLYEFEPNSESEMTEFLLRSAASEGEVLNVVHCWSLSPEQRCGPAMTPQSPASSVFALISLWRVLEEATAAKSIKFFLISHGAAQVHESDSLIPENGALLSACRVAEQEYERFSCRTIDVSLSNANGDNSIRTAELLFHEMLSDETESAVAYRNEKRYISEYRLSDSGQELLAPDVVGLEKGGVYLITGGLGSLGPVIASSFADKAPCKLILTTRSDFPPRSLWNVPQDNDRLRKTIEMFESIERKGAQVQVVKADAGNLSEMESLLDWIYVRFGRLDGVVHLAGVTGEKAMGLISDVEAADCKRQFQSKADGLLVLANVLDTKPVSFCVVFSSTASLIGGSGMGVYAAVNGFLDNHVLSRRRQDRRLRWIGINWDGWLLDGASVVHGSSTSLDTYAIPGESAIGILHEIIASSRSGQYVVSVGPMASRLRALRELKLNGLRSENRSKKHARPALTTEYSAPVNPSQQALAEIWREVLGVDHVGVNDNFFELGGSSLIALRMNSLLRKRLNLSLPLVSIFEAPTIRTFARLIHPREQAPEMLQVAEEEAGRSRGALRRARRMNRIVSDSPALRDREL